MKTTPPSLTPRLRTIADNILPCGTVADIGTDHAYLPVYLCMTQKCRRAIASDIRRGPISRAQDTVDKYSVGDLIETRLGSGAETLMPGEADCIVVAGMGGLIISEIIKASREIFDGASRILLQPMTAADELRLFLNGNGYTIENEFLAKEDRKIYNILSVKKGQEPKYTPSELYLGKRLIQSRPPHFDEYLKTRSIRLEKMINGLKLSSDTADAEKKLKYLTEIADTIKNLI